jgi:hypothetical protein
MVRDYIAVLPCDRFPNLVDLADYFTNGDAEPGPRRHLITGFHALRSDVGFDLQVHLSEMAGAERC